MKISLFLILLLASSFSMAAYSDLCPGQEGYYFKNYRHRNPQQGGFVAYTAYADEDSDLFIAKTAAVCDYASVSGNSKILGRSVVRGSSEVSDDSQIRGQIHIVGNTIVSGKSVIMGKGQLKAKVYNNERVKVNTKFLEDIFQDLKKYVNFNFNSVKSSMDDNFNTTTRLSSEQGNFCRLRIERRRVRNKCDARLSSSLSAADRVYFNISEVGSFNSEYYGIKGSLEGDTLRSDVDFKRVFRSVECNSESSWPWKESV